jgi:hypothetical protein
MRFLLRCNYFRNHLFHRSTRPFDAMLYCIDVLSNFGQPFCGWMVAVTFTGIALYVHGVTRLPF